MNDPKDFKRLCAMIKEKAVANVGRIYQGTAQGEAQAKATTMGMVEKLTKPENVAAFCDRNGLTYGNFTAIIFGLPFLFTKTDAGEIMKTLEDEKAA